MSSPKPSPKPNTQSTDRAADRSVPGSEREALSFCRLCMGHCGVVATLDEAGGLLRIRGDHDDPQTLGYACFKGLNAPEAHRSPDRVLTPRKRMPDGRFVELPLEVALDEIAAKLAAILAEDGPEAIGGYKGGGAFFTSSSLKMLNAFLEAIGSPKAFSSVTIDQSAKAVAVGRIGIWPPGRTPFHRGDVFLIVGGNPLVSVSTNGFDTRNPLKRLKEAKARGMKLIVIDPRRSETAKHADLHLQPLPGEDAAILAGLLHVILERGWIDRDFCDRHADDVEALRRAVAGFTPKAVAARAGVAEAELVAVAELFARESRTGAATSATGPDMSPHGNLAEHLVECLNVVCGRLLRAGDRIDHPGAIGARYPRKAEVMPAPRWWEKGYKSRVGAFGRMDGELPTGILADEILMPGKGRVRALLVHGGNPASAIPDTKKVVRALESLELLVAIEPFMSMTAELAHYILPPTLQYERADLPLFIYENLLSPVPFTRYTPAIASPPPGAKVCDDHLYFWELAKRLGVRLNHFGVELGGDRPPTTDELLAIAARHAPIAFDALQAAPRGVVLDDEPVFVEPGDPDSPHRFSLVPPDVAAELASVAAGLAPGAAGDFPYRLAVRRLRDGLNSAGLSLPSIRKRLPFNPVYMNPEDMAAEGIGEGHRVAVASAHGRVEVRAEADPSLRRGVVSLVHGFGQLPSRSAAYEEWGVAVNLLLSLEPGSRETINAMPRMSGIAVAVRRCEER
ncbi:MAG: molybdopterin-dependent oxidoreductase [Deltaproteobacteria bacterium]|nr:molybdopterin-dependent oxidoreductase [Deltaproteobacteria bacterium]